MIEPVASWNDCRKEVLPLWPGNAAGRRVYTNSPIDLQHAFELPMVNVGGPDRWLSVKMRGGVAGAFLLWDFGLDLIAALRRGETLDGTPWLNRGWTSLRSNQTRLSWWIHSGWILKRWRCVILDASVGEVSVMEGRRVTN